MCLKKKKKPTEFWMGPFKKGVAFHLELVVILAMGFYRHGSIYTHTWQQGLLWRCLDTMITQIRAHLSFTSPSNTPKRSERAFMLRSSKENWLKALFFKRLPFQSYYFPITKGAQIEISGLICCFPPRLIGVFLSVKKRELLIFPVSHQVVILPLGPVT